MRCRNFNTVIILHFNGAMDQKSLRFRAILTNTRVLVADSLCSECRATGLHNVLWGQSNGEMIQFVIQELMSNKFVFLLHPLMLDTLGGGYYCLCAPN